MSSRDGMVSRFPPGKHDIAREREEVLIMVYVAEDDASSWL